MSDAGETDRERMAAVDAVRLRANQPNRDKRNAVGRRRYVRQVGDHYLLVAACRGSSHCARAAGPLGVCSACGGASLTPGEKRAAAPPG